MTPHGRSAIDVGDLVRICAGGVNVFKVLEIEGDHAVIESVQESAPGRYPWPVALAHLVPADSDAGQDQGSS